MGVHVQQSLYRLFVAFGVATPLQGAFVGKLMTDKEAVRQVCTGGAAAGCCCWIGVGHADGRNQPAVRWRGT